MHDVMCSTAARQAVSHAVLFSPTASGRRPSDPYAGSYGTATSSGMEGASLWGGAVSAAMVRQNHHPSRPETPPPRPAKPPAPDLKASSPAPPSCHHLSSGRAQCEGQPKLLLIFGSALKRNAAYIQYEAWINCELHAVSRCRTYSGRRQSRP